MKSEVKHLTFQYVLYHTSVYTLAVYALHYSTNNANRNTLLQYIWCIALQTWIHLQTKPPNTQAHK